MLGWRRLEYLDRVWWKLHKIRARLGTNCDPPLIDCSSEGEMTDEEVEQGARKKQRVGGFSSDEVTKPPQEPVTREKRGLPEPESEPPGKRQCSEATQSAALHLPPPCPLGALTPDLNAPLADRYPAGHRNMTWCP